MSEAKTTKAYKVSPELKEKLERLATESGLETQEAFIEHLAALYDLQRLKEGNGSGYRKQIDELEYHLRRPLDLFIGMVETEAADRLQLMQQHDETLAGRSATIYGQEQEIADLRKAAKVQADELARLTKENEAQVKLVEQLEAAARDKGLLVEQYKEKNDTLAGLVNQYKAAGEQNKELQTKVNELTLITDKQAERVIDLEEGVAALQRRKEEALRQQEERHREVLERLAERKEIEKERELLAIRTEYQSKLEKTNEDATAKLRELYDQLERQRAAHEQELRAFQNPKADDEKTPPKK